MPLIATKGAASSQGFGEFAQASGLATYIEDVFSTYLYTGTGASLTITNNIDLSTKGGLTWIKSRSAATDNKLTDTARGVTKALISDTTGAQTTDTTGLTAFGTTGFTIGANTDYNTSAATYASWTFRKQTKFFDVVTYTGTGANTTIAHSLGSVPGCIIVKRTDTTSDWQVYHSSLANTEYLVLNTTAAKATGASRWNSTTPTASVFSLGASITTNASGGTYVAYIYASNAGGFGLAGTDNVITCGSYTGNGSTTGPIVTLNYEPQWIMIKGASSAQSWVLFDSMRGLTALGGNEEFLQANAADAALTGVYDINPTATGFQVNNSASSFNASGQTYIYVAIRRGPMKVPTDATTVFQPVTYTGTVLNTAIGTMGPIDAFIVGSRDGYGTSYSQFVFDRLRGSAPELGTANTGTEVAFSSTVLKFDTQAGWNTNTSTTSYINGSGYNYVSWNFKRAPSFFDEVCWTGSGAAKNITHNLSVAPELVINKNRTGTANDWCIWPGPVVSGNNNTLFLNNTQAIYAGINYWGSSYSSSMTSTTFSVGSSTATNESGSQYVSYLFATLAGVSKVGTYSGTGATQTVACGFTGGARFVLVKRTDSTGAWYIWDTARGMVAGTDPSLLFNSTAAEVNANSIYTATGGFQIVSTAVAINASGGTYIFLAIA
jgi:hypothetical protein